MARADGSDERPGFYDTFRALLRSLTSSWHFGMPAKVVSFDEDKRRCTVEPISKRKLASSGEIVKYGVVEHVPVVTQDWGDWEIAAAYTKGSEVWLAFGERSIEQWLSDGGDPDPEDFRRYDLSDAVVMGGIRPYTESHAPVGDRLHLRHRDGGAEVVLHPDGKVVINSDDIRLGSDSSSDGLVRQSDFDSHRNAVNQRFVTIDTQLSANNPTNINWPSGTMVLPLPQVTSSNNVKAD